MAAAAVAVVGSINIDVAVRARRLPAPGETVHGDSFALGLGGKGANQACAAARLGADVTFVGCIGTDGFGDMALAALGRFGLGTNHVRRVPETGTGMAVIGIDSAGQNAITIVAGANAALGHADLDSASAHLSMSKVLLLQCEIPLDSISEAARRMSNSGGIVVLDPAPVPHGGIPADLARRVALVTPNESEASSLTGITVRDPESGLAAARFLRRERGFQGAIVKLGGQGVVFSTESGEGLIPPFVVPVIDTVAAGDCFNAGLAVALAESRPFPDSLRFAAACGAISVTKRGAADAAPTRGEVTALLAGTTAEI